MNIDDKYVFAIQGRTIIPSISSQIAVATDINSRRIVFKIPMYIDGYNINDSIISVRCVNAAKKFSQYVLTEREIRSGDDNTYIYAEWVIGADVTSTSGQVIYDITITDDTQSSYAWHTLPASFMVEAGIQIPENN